MDKTPKNIIGEIRIYIDGRMELRASGDLFYPIWIPGHIIAKARYSNKTERNKIISKALEVFKDIEIGIIPDDIEAVLADMELKEKDLKTAE